MLIMEGNMVSFMGSLVYDWLLNAGDEKLAKEFKKEANPEPLPPNSPRLADIVKHYKETTPQKRKAEPAVKAAPAPAKAAAKKEESALNQFPFTPVTPVHSCTRCEKVFKVMSSLTRHMADKHNFVKIPKGKRRRGDRIQVDQ